MALERPNFEINFINFAHMLSTTNKKQIIKRTFLIESLVTTQENYLKIVVIDVRLKLRAPATKIFISYIFPISTRWCTAFQASNTSENICLWFHRLLYLGTLCMIMVKDKLFIEHNIFHQVCFTLLRPEVGVAPRCVLVCGAGMCANRSISNIDLDLIYIHSSRSNLKP